MQPASLTRRRGLHDHAVRTLALHVMERERMSSPALLPTEEELCRELEVSRTVVRESLKVLADKGMVAMRPRVGTQIRPRSEWRLLDPDILAWQAELNPDPRFLRDLCEVRLAIEPVASGFAAVRATPEDLTVLEACLREREGLSPAASYEAIVDLDLDFHLAVVAASHNSLLAHLSGVIRQPIRALLALTSRVPASVALGMDAHRELVDALGRKDPMGARAASEQIVGLAMLSVEEVIRSWSADEAPGTTTRRSAAVRS